MSPPPTTCRRRQQPHPLCPLQRPPAAKLRGNHHRRTTLKNETAHSLLAASKGRVAISETQCREPRGMCQEAFRASFRPPRRAARKAARRRPLRRGRLRTNRAARTIRRSIFVAVARLLRAPTKGSREHPTRPAETSRGRRAREPTGRRYAADDREAGRRRARQPLDARDAH